MTAANCPKCSAPLPTTAPEGLCPKCLLQAGLQSEADSPGKAETSPSPQANRSFTPPTPEELAEHFPQLEILDLIGQGGMGAVYKARQRDLDRLVALKILPPEVGSDPAFAERFNREARALARLSHVNIVAVFDTGKVNGLYYLLMEYINGVNLRQAMQAGSISPEEAIAIVPQICDALQYAHDEGIVHRDIKPENVLVDPKGRVKIADFGLAKLLQHESTNLTLTQAHQVMGTPRYMAPEQMTASHDVDHRADIYSLGVVFYELLTGEVPMGRFDPPSQRVQVDVRLDEIVLRTLDREPDRRYQRASEIKTDVETLHSRPAAPPPKPNVVTHADSDSLDEARDEVKVPAMGLVAVGVLTCLSGVPVVLVLLAMAFLVLAPGDEPMDGPPIEMIPKETLSSDFSASGHGPVSSEDWHETETPDFELITEPTAEYDPGSPAEAVAFGPMLIVIICVVFSLAIPILVGGVIALGGWRMMQLTSHGWATMAAILALLPCHPAWLLGLIFGIWGLIVLNRPHIRAAFHRTPYPNVTSTP